MHIIFGQVNNWQVSLIKLLKYFKFEVFYLFIESKSEFENNKIANELKKKNIIPVPNELGKNIPPKTYSLYALDIDEISYKKNINMIPDKILKGYCSLFSINEKKVKKLRLMLQDVIGAQMSFFLSRIETWSVLNPSTKIILVNFKLINFFIPNSRHNIVKITIPIDILIHFVKVFKKILLFFFIFLKKNKKHKNEILDDKNLDKLDKKAVALVTHKGLIYGTEVNKIFNKTLYYSEDINSCLHKYNILHLDYSDFPKPEKNICWISLNKTKFSNIQVFLKTLLASIQTIYLIRSWNTFLVWLLIIPKFNTYIRYCEIIKKFKKLKIAIIDHDYLCPKTLILALEKNNVRVVATQDRFITIFYKSFYNVILDTYYVASEYIANVIKNSKYHDIKNIIPVGQYRSDYLSIYKNKTIPEEIAKAKDNGKKILIILGHRSPNYQFQSYINPVASWSAQMDFLEDCMKLSKNLNNTFMILRYKSLDWLNNNEYFENILNKINNCENIIISNRQNESLHGYKLCAHADLVIAKHTSLADECLSTGIPVLFNDYTHNQIKLQCNVPNYLPPELICYNFNELLETSKSLLFNSSSKLKNEITKLNKTIYYVKEKGNIKNKIIENLENLLNST